MASSELQKINQDLTNKNNTLEEKLRKTTMRSQLASVLDSTYSDLLHKDGNTTEIILVRHGQTVWNVLHKYQGQGDSELTDVGKLGALKVGKKLHWIHKNDRNIDCIYSSPLKRAKQTTEIISKQFNDELDIKYDNRIMERDFGDLQGQTSLEIKESQPEIYSKLQSKIDYRPPNGESLLDVTNRAIRFLAEISAKHYGKRVLVVCHGGVLQVIFNDILVGHCTAERAFHCKNCAVNIIQRNPKNGKWYVTLLGDDNYGDYQSESVGNCEEEHSDVTEYKGRDMTGLLVGFVVGCLVGYGVFKRWQ